MSVFRNGVTGSPTESVLRSRERVADICDRARGDGVVRAFWRVGSSGRKMAGLHDSVVPELRRGPATSPRWVAFGMGSIRVLLLGFEGFPSRNHLGGRRGVPAQTMSRIAL